MADPSKSYDGIAFRTKREQIERINRAASPMNFVDEDLDGERERREKARREFERTQSLKSPFLIGSIEEVNRKIGNLDQKLQGYTELVVESRLSENDELRELFPSSAKGRDRYQQREREAKEVCKFAGIYTVKATFIPGMSTRVKNIAKISMHSPPKTAQAKKDLTAAPGAGKPKFVELHQYPGYDPQELTPLPDDIPAKAMLEKAVNASHYLDHKPHYKPTFERWYYSPMSQAILLDIFWYFFLEKFQSSKNSQVKLFNRVSHNYVKLMTHCAHPVFRDTFFRSYSLLLAQAVYASFCHAFPDSYRQFGEVFKDDLVGLVYEWTVGLKPSPRSWIPWNLEMLEPPNIRIRGDDTSSKKPKQTNMGLTPDQLDMLISSNQSQYTSCTSLIPSTARSSLSSTQPKKLAVVKRGSQQPTRRQMHLSVPQGHSPSKMHSPASSHDSQLIEAVAKAQRVSPRKASRGSVAAPPESHRMSEVLAPIREMTTENDEAYAKYSQISTTTPRNLPKQGELEMESHPACRGPEFHKGSFNIYGCSPLLAHFMRTKKLETEAGTDVHVKRTEVDKLPALDTPTYQEIIRESFANVRKIKKDFQKMYARNQRHNSIFAKKQLRELKEFERNESALLANTKEVTRLSNLIILEQKRGLDSVSVKVDAAFEAALMAAASE